MTLHKNPLAIAIASAISMVAAIPASADTYDSTTTPPPVIDSQSSTDFSSVTFDEVDDTGSESSIQVNVDNGETVTDSIYFVDSTLSDVSIDNSGTITATNTAVDPVNDPAEYDTSAIAVDQSTITGTITNSGNIEGDNGIEVFNGSVTGNVDNSGDITGSSNAILVGAKSTFEGNITNTGDLTGTTESGIDIADSIFTGNITNAVGSSITGGYDGINISDHIDEGADPALNAQPTTVFTGDIINNGDIVGTNHAGINIASEEEDGSTTFNGNITNSGSISSTNGGIGINVNDADFNGNIDNRTAASISNISIATSNFTGNITNAGPTDESSNDAGSTGDISITYDSTFIGDITNAGSTGDIRVENYSTVTGDLSNSGTIDDFFVSNSHFDGDITNATGGTIDGIDFSGAVLTGDITNESGATIQGGIELLNNTLVDTTITNAGDIVGVSGRAAISAANLTDQDSLTINNTGTIGQDNGSVPQNTAGIDVSGNASTDVAINNGDKGIIAGNVLGIDTTDNSGNVTITNSGLIKSESYVSSNIGIDAANNSGNITITNTGSVAAYGPGGVGIYTSNNTGTIDVNLNGGRVAGDTGILLDSGVTANMTAGSISGLTAVDNQGGIFNQSGGEISGDIVNNLGTVNLSGSASIDGGIRNSSSGTVNLSGSTSVNAGIANTLGTVNLSGSASVNNGVINSGTFNFTGGTISGNVDNTGTFAVEGKRTIDGAYSQDSGTLSLALDDQGNLGLHANSFNISDSALKIDLTKSTMYVADGQTVSVLTTELDPQTQKPVVLSNIAFNNTLTEEDLANVVNSEFVSARAAIYNEVDGTYDVTFERQTFTSGATNAAADGTVSGQQSGNVQQVANALDNLAIVAGNTQQAEMALLINSTTTTEQLEELLPETAGSSSQAANTSVNISNAQISGRSRSAATGDTFTKTGFWMQGLASRASQDKRDGIAGYDADTNGIVLGLDGELDNGLVIGAAYSYTNTDVDGRYADSDIDYNMLTGYFGYSLGQLILDGQVYYGIGDNETKRSIGAKGDYDSTVAGARVAAGYQFNLNQTAQFIPTVSLDYSHLSVDSYTEKGSVAALHMDDQDYDRLELGLAAELNNTYQINEMLVTPRLSLGVYHDFEAEAQSVNAAFAIAPTTVFKSEGADPEKTRYTVGLGVGLAKGDNFSADLDYNYNWQSDYDAHVGALKLRWEF